MQGLTALAVHKFKRSYLGVVSICFIASVGFVSIFAYVLSPDRSQYANQMHLSIHSKPPGFHVQMLVQPNALKARQNKLNFKSFNKSKNALDQAMNDSSKNDVVFVIGSVYLISEILS